MTESHGIGNEDQGGRSESKDDFAAQADLGNRSLLREIMDLILENKKWWLVPVVIVILLLGLLSLLMSSALAPFIYPLF